MIHFPMVGKALLGLALGLSIPCAAHAQSDATCKLWRLVRVCGDAEQRAVVTPDLVFFPPANIASWPYQYGARIDLNDEGVVAGTMQVGSDQHAFMWNTSLSPCEDQLVDLNPSGESDSLAVGIGNNGWVVGGAGGAVPSSTFPAAWRPSSGSMVFEDLTGDVGESIAFCWAVSDTTDPFIVGLYQMCSNGSQAPFWFDWAAPEVRIPLPSLVGFPGETTPQGCAPSGDWWVGFQKGFAIEECDQLVSVFGCPSGDDATWGLEWQRNDTTTPPSADVAEVPPLSGSSHHLGTTARDCDQRSDEEDTRVAVGWGQQYYDESQPCQRHFIFWDLSGAIYTDLHSLVIDPSMPTEGTGVRELWDGRLLATGHQTTDVPNNAHIALVAEHDGGANYGDTHWCLHELQPWVKSCEPDLVLLEQAHSVNRCGSISAVALFDDGDTATHEAVRLCHIADLDADESVDGADLGILFGAWGTSACIPDITENGVVNGADLGYVISAWRTPSLIGTTCGECQPGEGSASGRAASSPVSGEALLNAVQAAGFQDLDALAAWGAEAGSSQLSAVVSYVRAYLGLEDQP